MSRRRSMMMGGIPPVTLPASIFKMVASSGVTLTSGKVSAVDCGNGYVAQQSNATWRPTPQTVNEVPVFRFANSGLRIPSLALQQYCMFLVFKATANGFLYEHSPNVNLTTGGAYLYSTTGSTCYIERNNTGFGQDHVNNWGIDGTKKIVCYRFQKIGTSFKQQLFVNSTTPVIDSATGMTEANANLTVTDTLFIGNRNETNLWISMDLAHMEALPALTDEQLAIKMNELTTLYNAF